MKEKNRIIYLAFVLIIILTLFVTTFIFLDKNKDIEFTEDKTLKHWQGMVMLGLAPSTESRQILPHDEDTGVRLEDENGDMYALIRSQNFVTNDFGETFVVKIN